VRQTIVVTDRDMRTLTHLLATGNWKGRDQQHLVELADELERAEVVRSSEVPRDVVTLGSRVRVRDLEAGTEETYRLGLSSLAGRGPETHLSVLAPIGTALLGYREGDEIEWRVPGGIRRLQVVAVVSPPSDTGAVH
jgi:regulator of nucleoside diphosphate kinase